MSAPDDLDRHRRHRQPRPASHWGPPDDLTPHPGDVASCEVCTVRRLIAEVVADCEACNPTTEP